jgi:hypothetical protein
MSRVSILAALTVFAVCTMFVAPAQATLATCDFASDPNWSAVGNAASQYCTFGYSSSTNHANGGTGPTGEIGGAFAKQTSGAHYYYASLSVTYNDPFEINWNTANPASLYYDDADGSRSGDMAMLSFFNKASLNSGSWTGDTPATQYSFAGLYLRGDEGARLSCWDAATGGTNDLRFGPTSFVSGSTHSFRMKYDPNGGVNHYGQFSVRFNEGAVVTTDLTQAIRNSGTVLDGFGLWMPQTPLWTQDAGKCHYYFDNLIYGISPVPEPSALLLLSSGIAGLLAYAWRKRK